MIPDHLYGGDEQTLVRSMYASERGTKAYHIEMGILLAEEAALETCVNGEDDGILAEEAAI